MKKAILIAVVAFVSASVYAQGTINFPRVELRYEDGTLVTGGFLAALYFAPPGVTDDSMFMQIGAAAGFVAPGVIIGGTRTVALTPPGAPANFQVKAWQESFDTYEEAAATPGACFGASTIFEVDTGNPFAEPPEPPANLPDPVAFSVNCVPEPSVFALGALGAGALLLLRRRT